MNRGDLVKLKPYCRDSDRIAILLDEDYDQCRIAFADTGEKVIALKRNLVLYKEEKK
tara:strand:+ start:570 stop:740 length:171 start_codon:yes stop_codon:yes gene_type:complete